MINSLCGSMGSLKNDSCATKLRPSSPNEPAVSESRKAPTPPSSEYDHASGTSLVPPSLKFPALKLQPDQDVEIQSPDRCLWEFFADQLEGDFMISSPVRNVPSSSPAPQAASGYQNTTTHDIINNNSSSYNFSHAQAQAMHGLSLMVCSPSPPRMSSPLGPYNRDKGKGLSPLHRVLNSPNHEYMQVESLSLPALEFLDDLDKDDDDFGGSYSNSCKGPDIAGISSSDCFDLSSVPELLECLTMPNPAASSRFCGSMAETEDNDTSTTTSNIYQLSSSGESAPLLQQLQQERQQEKQQQLGSISHRPNHQPPPPVEMNLNSSLMVQPLSIGPEQEQDSGLRLVHLLLACAEAVAKEEYMLARRYLHHLNRVVTPLGDSMQRVASCFAEALGARLAATLTAKPATAASRPFNPFPPNSLEILKIYQILYQACPYIKFAHFTANQAIFEAFEAEERVHVIDLDILQGYQWPAFMQALAARPGGAPFLRITGVGPYPEAVRETGRCLTELAHSLHIPFEFHPVGEQLEDLKPHMLNRRVGEALAVNSVNRLHWVPGNSLGNLLGMIRDQAPNIVTIVEQEASHNGPYFLGRFLEALHYYSAIFDSLDATFPAESAQRAKVEQYIFAPEIRNIVAEEGRERVRRHERLEKWRKIMEGKGYKGVGLSTNAVTQSKILLGLYSCEGYRLTEDKGCLLLGWQDRAIVAASAWRC
ncbi:unnamed protein product [Coffea canephora]|uniref:Uncharacterized protein n=1 Tax=Coffea canephora TaxID=49390 RepID=A0A068VAP7_COFCA|nr:unnamed protein product [Coffea canephora]